MRELVLNMSPGDDWSAAKKHLSMLRMTSHRDERTCI
jgi:hypothetical protein